MLIYQRNCKGALRSQMVMVILRMRSEIGEAHEMAESKCFLLFQSLRGSRQG